MKHVVVVGGSIAAVTAADGLRQAGFEGRITMLSDEGTAPYSRPPLSKGVLKGTETVHSTAISMAGIDCELMLDARVAGIDRERSRIRLAGGDELGYDGLVIATGARARRLLGADGPERVVRDLPDAFALQREFRPGRSLTVIGGGFLGMEVASTARTLGLEVTVVDMLPHLERQFGQILAAHMTAAARERGVRLIHSPAGVRIVDGQHVMLGEGDDASELASDLVLTAVGDVPNVEWLDGSGLATPAGVVTDDRGRVAPGIVAAGDVAMVDFGDGSARRTPHWGAAIDQARIAAFGLVRADEAPRYTPRPYFWTEQWDLDMKICGTITADAEMVELEGSLAEGEAVLQFRTGGRGCAAVSVNRRVPIPKLRRLVDQD